MTKPHVIIRKARKARKLSLRQAGTLAGVSEGAIRHIEDGRGDTITLSKVLRALNLVPEPALPAERRQVAKLPPFRVFNDASVCPDTTPVEFLRAVLRGIHRKKFDLDPCAPLNPAHRVVPARRCLTVADDALAGEWPTADVVWCNPPYEAIPEWVAHALEQRRAGNVRALLFLLPFRTRSLATGKLLARVGHTFSLIEPLHFGQPPRKARDASVLFCVGLTATEIAGLRTRLPEHDYSPPRTIDKSTGSAHILEYGRTLETV